MKLRHPLPKLLVHVLLVVGGLLCLFPLLWMVMTSLKPIEETMKLPPQWLPSHWQWHNYKDAVLYQRDKLGYTPFLRYGLNTLYLAAMTVPGVILSNALVAYGFARIQWRGRETLFAITLATMMIPFPVTMVPM